MYTEQQSRNQEISPQRRGVRREVFFVVSFLCGLCVSAVRLLGSAVLIRVHRWFPLRPERMHRLAEIADGFVAHAAECRNLFGQL